MLNAQIPVLSFFICYLSPSYVGSPLSSPYSCFIFNYQRACLEDLAFWRRYCNRCHVKVLWWRINWVIMPCKFSLYSRLSFIVSLTIILPSHHEPLVLFLWRVHAIHPCVHWDSSSCPCNRSYHSLVPDPCHTYSYVDPRSTDDRGFWPNRARNWGQIIEMCQFVTWYIAQAL
jgi:hypothetical protein